MKKPIIFVVAVFGLLGIFGGCVTNPTPAAGPTVAPDSTPVVEGPQTPGGLDYLANPLLALLPYEMAPRPTQSDLDDLVNAFVAGVENVSTKFADDLKLASRAIALSNPIYTPSEMLSALTSCFLGFREDEDGWAYYQNQYIYIGDDAMAIEPFSWVLAHELMHALSLCDKPKVFPHRIDDIQGVVWGERIAEGLADLYAFAALDGQFWRLVGGTQLQSYVSIDAQVGGTLEQASALVFVNALGRAIVARAYFGSQDDHQAIADYYEGLVGRPFSQFLSAAEEWVAYAYEFADREPNREAASQAGRKYLDLVIEVCEKRVSSPIAPLEISEVDALIALSFEIYDPTYMAGYYAALAQIRLAIP
ncbi:MAG: hypothetical protein LBE83_03155 [Propionibacteriaceae bacterium]|jgi:hypothetical protein|nr:hypothetical protein [Propionibacteriaceae bacterium]